MESTGILVSTSQPADNVHLAPSICNAPIRFLESRSLSSGQSKSQSQKRTLVQPIPQTLSFSSPAPHRNLFWSTAPLPLQRESRKGESDCDRETQIPSKSCRPSGADFPRSRDVDYYRPIFGIAFLKEV